MVWGGRREEGSGWAKLASHQRIFSGSHGEVLVLTQGLDLLRRQLPLLCLLQCYHTCSFFLRQEKVNVVAVRSALGLAVDEHDWSIPSFVPSSPHTWKLLSRHLCACSYTHNVGAKGARFFPWGADALWQNTCLRIHPLTLPSP